MHLFGLFFLYYLFSKVASTHSLQDLEIGITKRAVPCTQRAYPGDVVDVHYTGYLRDDGKQFDSSYTRDQPISFILNAGQVIYGWEKGLLGTCVGEERKIQIPSRYAYGEVGVPGVIPPNSDMIFDVKLVSIRRENIKF